MTWREGGPPAEDDPGCWCAEAEQLAVENAGLGRENAAQRVRIADLEGQVAALTEKVATLTTLVVWRLDREEEAARPAPAPPAGGRAGRVRGPGAAARSGRWRR